MPPICEPGMSFQRPRWRGTAWSHYNIRPPAPLQPSTREGPCKSLSSSAISFLFALLLRLLIPRQHIVRAFPRRQVVEIAEFLGQLYRFVDDSLALFVVADL